MGFLSMWGPGIGQGANSFLDAYKTTKGIDLAEQAQADNAAYKKRYEDYLTAATERQQKQDEAKAAQGEAAAKSGVVKGIFLRSPSSLDVLFNGTTDKAQADRLSGLWDMMTPEDQGALYKMWNDGKPKDASGSTDYQDYVLTHGGEKPTAEQLAGFIGSKRAPESPVSGQITTVMQDGKPMRILVDPRSGNIIKPLGEEPRTNASGDLSNEDVMRMYEAAQKGVEDIQRGANVYNMQYADEGTKKALESATSRALFWRDEARKRGLLPDQGGMDNPSRQGQQTSRFNSAESVRAAVLSGVISKDEGLKILREQFGME